MTIYNLQLINIKLRKKERNKFFVGAALDIFQFTLLY